MYQIMEEMVKNDESIVPTNLSNHHIVLLFNFVMISFLHLIKNRKLFYIFDESMMIFFMFKMIDIFINSIVLPTIIDLVFKFIKQQL